MGAFYYIGTSGWHYPHWQGPFYPQDLAPAAWLGYYAQHFATVEINASFYRLPSSATARAWKNATPAGFTFAIKASRYITHMKKLRAPRTSLRAFLAVTQALGNKCGPLLFQLPPRWRCNPERLAAFLRALPKNRDCAFELRDPSWHNPEVYTLLQRYNAAFCIYELAGFESPQIITADFTYIRLAWPRRLCYAARIRIERWQCGQTASAAGKTPARVRLLRQRRSRLCGAQCAGITYAARGRRA